MRTIRSLVGGSIAVWACLALPPATAYGQAWTPTNGASCPNPGNHTPNANSMGGLISGMAPTCSCGGLQFAANNHGCTCPCNCPKVGGDGQLAGGQVAGGQQACVSCGGGGNGGQNIPPSPTVNPDMPVQPPYPRIMSDGGSLIDNTNLTYFHWGWDFPKSAEDGVGLARIHRPRDQSLPGTFGPGVFSNYDQTITLSQGYTTTGASAIFAELFDPLTTLRRNYQISVSSFSAVMSPISRQTLKGVTLLKADLTPIVATDPAGFQGFYGAKFARAEAFDGSFVLFKLFDVGVVGARTGRVAQATNVAGTLTVTFKTWTATELTQSPTRALQFDTITDRYGKTLAFTYGTAQVGGQWAVSSITGPGPSGTTTRSYGYTGANISSVTYPDGATSTFTYTPDNVAKATAIGFFDRTAPVGHQRKTAYASFAITAQVSPGYFVAVSIPMNSIRMITNGDTEVAYLSTWGGQGYSSFHYEGGGRLKAVTSATAPLGSNAGTNPPIDSGYMTTGWAFANPPTGAGVMFTGTREPVASLTLNSASSMNGPNSLSAVDANGVNSSYQVDSDSWIVSAQYADNTIETYCYNAAKKITRQRDRDGNVTRRLYNTANQLIEEQVGLRDNPANVAKTWYMGLMNPPPYDRCATNDVQQPEYAVRKWEYVAAGNPGAGLVSAYIDERNNRTDYQYTTDGRLWKVLQPADVVGGPRATTIYAYNAMGIVSSITDPKGHLTTFDYDYLGRLVSTNYEDGTSEKTEYGTTGNGAGLVVKTVDRLNVVTTYAYDASQRLTTKVTAAAVRGSGGAETPTPYGVAVTETIQYVHGSDLVWKRTVNGAMTEYFYDYRGRPTQEKTFPRAGVTLTSTTTYDKNRVQKETDPYGRATYYAYNASDSRLVRTVQGMVPEWTPPAGDLNTVLLNLTRDLAPNARFLVNDKVFSAAGLVTTQTNPLGTQTRLTYDSRGRNTVRQDAFGTTIEARTETIYDATNNVTEVRTPRYFDAADTNGYQKCREQWTYNGRNRQATHTEAPGTPVAATESFTYDLDGTLASKTDFGGNLWTSDETGCCDLVRRSTDPLGHGTIAEANARKQVVRTQQVADIATFNAATVDNPKVLTEATTRYDSRGRPIYRTQWLIAQGPIDTANPPIAGLDGIPLTAGLTTQYLYDDNLADGIGIDSATGVAVPKLGTDGTGTFNVSLAAAITKLADTQANGGAAVVLNSASPGSAQVVVNGEDELSFSISDATGRSVMSGKINNYRGSGATALGTLAEWSCSVHDGTTSLSGYGTLVISQNVDALGYSTQSWSDAAGRTRRTFDQLGAVATASFNALGSTLTTRDPNNVGADRTYDALGRNLQSTDTFGDVTKTNYNRAGALVQAIDGKNKSTYTSYDARGRRKTVSDRINAVTSFAYTALGQLASLTDAENQTTSYSYDAKGNKITETYPDHVAGAAIGSPGYGVVTFIYDAAGRVLRKQDQRGDTCLFNYNRAGQLTSRDYRTFANSPSGAIADTDSFTFDRTARPLTAISERYANTVAYTYDPAGRKSDESLSINSHTYVVGTAYNARGETITVTYPNSSVQTRSYHPTGALNQVSLDGDVVSTRAYDPGRRMTSETLGNGIVETRTYRADNLIVTIGYGAAAVGNLSYSWDANKNKTGESIAGVMSGFSFASTGTTYDDENRLTGFQQTSNVQTWNLTAVGDWASTTINGTAQIRTHGPTHELLTAGGQAVTTDVEGNVTSIPVNQRTAGATTSLNLTWDADNRLLNADIDANGTPDVSYRYDAFGRRVARSAAVGSVVYVQFGRQTMADYPLGGVPATPTIRYAWGEYVDEPIVRKSETATHYYHRNQQYTIYAVSDAAGAMVERYGYTAYGQPTIASPNGTTIPASTIDNRYTYTSREWDAAVGLHYFRARWINSVAGRFLGRDPIAYRGSQWNLNEAIASKPTKLLDPLGLYTPPCQSQCGTDVTSAVEGLKESVVTAMNRLIRSGQAEKVRIACDDLTGIPTAAYAWDLHDLHNWREGRFESRDCGKGHCKGTVTFRGKCHWADDVNYAVFGVIRRQCAHAFADEYFGSDPEDPEYHPYLDGTMIAVGAWRSWRFYRYVTDLFHEPVGRDRFSTGVWSRSTWAIAGWYNDFELVDTTARTSLPCSPCSHKYQGSFGGYFGGFWNRVFF